MAGEMNAVGAESGLREWGAVTLEATRGRPSGPVELALSAGWGRCWCLLSRGGGGGGGGGLVKAAGSGLVCGQGKRLWGSPTGRPTQGLKRG